MNFREWKIDRNFSRLRNIEGTKFDDYNKGWINLIIEVIRDHNFYDKCIVKECNNKADVGAHVETFNRTKSIGIGIVPMCYEHNNLRGNLGIVDKKPNYRVFLMPSWREHGIRVAEWMFQNGERDIVLNNVRYVFSKKDFFITMKYLNGDIRTVEKYFHRV